MPAPNVDEALLERLSAYIDGESPPDEIVAIEELIATNPDVSHTVQNLKAASRSVSDMFLSHVEDQQIPSQWYKLVQEKSHSPDAQLRNWKPSWPLAASIALLCLSIGMSIVSYITVKNARQLQSNVAQGNNQSVTTVAELSRALMNALGQSDANASDTEQMPKSAPNDDAGSTNNVQHRLAITIARLREANDLADVSRKEIFQLNERLSAVSTELEHATNPVNQIVAYHRLSADHRIKKADRSDLLWHRAYVETTLRENFDQPANLLDLETHSLTFGHGYVRLINNNVAIQLQYTHKTGDPIDLWISSVNKMTELHTEHQRGDTNLITWTDTKHRYFVVGTLSLPELSNVATIIMNEN